MKTLIVIATLILTACSTPDLNPEIEKPRLTDSQYSELLSNHTRRAEHYDGFNNLYNIKVTILNTKVYSAVIDRVRFFKQYGSLEAQKEREKTYQKMSTETHFFVSYFSPQKGLTRLDRGDSLWKLYLDVNGRRVKAQIIKYPSIKQQTRALFPHHSRWSKGYLVKFRTPTNLSENHSAKLIMSSSAGSSVFTFPALR